MFLMLVLSPHRPWKRYDALELFAFQWCEWNAIAKALAWSMRLAVPKASRLLKEIGDDKDSLLLSFQRCV
jgi:hypothetical protein